MMKFKRTFTVLYLLVFIIYAIAPIVASLPQDDERRFGACVEDAPTARLMLAEVFAGLGEGQGTALKYSDSNDADILLKKKRALLSTKILFEVIFSALPVLDRPLVDSHVRIADATKPAYYSALHYCVSGVSPPSLS